MTCLRSLGLAASGLGRGRAGSANPGSANAGSASAQWLRARPVALFDRVDEQRAGGVYDLGRHVERRKHPDHAIIAAAHLDDQAMPERFGLNLASHLTGRAPVR